jgi:hypothetical protein
VLATWKPRPKSASKLSSSELTCLLQTLKSPADLVAAVSKLDRAVKRGVLHKNTAARKKSQLTKEYNAVAAKPYGTENPGTAKTKAKPAAKKPVAKAPAKKAAPKATAAKKPAAKKPASK